MSVYTVSSPSYDNAPVVKPTLSRKPAYSFRETKKGLQLLKYGKFVKYVSLDKQGRIV